MRTCVHQLPPEASIQQGPQATPEDLELPTIVTAAVSFAAEKRTLCPMTLSVPSSMPALHIDLLLY